jgi:hypothetical protein
VVVPWTRDANDDNTGNLVGATNAVDADDVAALIAKIGGRP